MTIQDAVNLGIKKLSKTSSSAALDAEVLLSHLMDQPKEYLLINPGKQLTLKQEKQFHILLTRRISGWPVAYIKNEKEFLGRKFYVDENVLIPRPETEGLVELIFNHLLEYKSKKPLNILDIGTGSGAIIVSIAKRCSAPIHRLENLEPINGHATKNLFFASDVSIGALKVAKRNAKTHKAKVTFKQGSLLEPWKKQSFDIIVANLPYLAKETDPSTKFEPKGALIAKKNGLALFEELFQQINSPLPFREGQGEGHKALIAPPLTPPQRGGGLKPSALFLEIGETQGPAIKKLAKQYLPGYETKISKDLSGRWRYAILTQKSS